MRWFANRKYKSGTGWCFWRWTDTDSKYIVRLHLLKTPWFAICLHWILKPDAEPWLHDHPVSFLSVILRGKYAELRQGPAGKLGILVHRWFNFIRASRFDKHRIIFARKNTLTLCFMGPKTREWGFHTDDGWIMWKDYYKIQRARKDAPLDRLVETLHNARQVEGDESFVASELELRHERMLRVLKEREEHELEARHDVVIDVDKELLVGKSVARKP